MQSRSFDFRKPASTGSETFKEVYSQAKHRFTDPEPQPQAAPTQSQPAPFQNTQVNQRSNSTPWVLTGVLTLGLIAMSTFALIQEQNFQRELDTNSSSTVAGARDVQEEYVISGDSFSLILNREAPTYFRMNRNLEEQGIFADRNSRLSEYVSEFNIDNQIRRSGVLVEVLDSDNKETPESFTELVISLLGEQGASVDQIGVKTGNDYTLTRLNTQSDSNTVYYTGVTAENYYVITTFSDASRQEITSEANAYSELFIPNLYLN